MSDVQPSQVLPTAVPPQGTALAEPFGYPAPEEEAQGGLNVARYLAALKRYKWLILVVAALGAGATVGATRFIKPEYTAQATIWVEGDKQANGPIRAEELLNATAWIELLRSFVVLDTVVAKTNLFLTPAAPGDSAVFRDFRLAERFRPGVYRLEVNEAGTGVTLSTDQGVKVGGGAPGDSLGREIGFLWAPAASTLGPKRRIDFTVVTPRDAAIRLRDDLVTRMAQNGNFLVLEFSGQDAHRIALVVNSLAEQFVQVAADLKKAKLKEMTKILSGQLEYAAAQLRDAENRLESFRVKTITLPNEAAPVAAGLQSTQPTVLSNYFQSKLELEELKRDRLAVEQLVANAAAGRFSPEAYQSVAAVKGSADLQRALTELTDAEAQLRALRYKYTDEYKPVKDLQDRITTLTTRTIPELTAALAAQLRAREATMQGQIASASQDLQEIPTRTITEQRYTREMLAAQTLYTNLQNRYEENKLAEASAIPDVRILDRAEVPIQPSKNIASRILLMGFGASLALAVGLAILLDMLDRRLRYPEQVKKLGLTVLGAIPAVRKTKDGIRDPEEASQVVEAFRTIRLNLVHSYGAAGPVTLTVSSPGPGDGKSFVSSNLALSFAEAGYRVVLVDGDIRRGELHRSFGVERKPGLLDCLSGSARLEEVLRPGGHPNLSVIPCGTRFERGPEMLGSPAMREVMAALRHRFNVLIVDSPPLGAGVDPFVLGTLTGNVMLVLRAGETDRQQAEMRLKYFDRLPVRLLGAVLNDIRTSESAYRYYSYVYGYTADEIDPRREIGAGAGAGSPAH